MEVILLIGMQGSGKNSLFRQRFASTHAHVSRDNFRHNPHPLRRQTALIEEALLAGRSVVVDNTHPSKVERAAVFEVARRFNVPVIGYYLDPDLSACIARNHQRTGKAARIPVVGLLATRKRLEPPSLEEGFAALFHVAMEGSGAPGFGVTPRPLGSQATGS